MRLRRATADDSRRFWEINNDPSVRARSVHPAAVPWELHCAWFDALLAMPRARLFVAELDARTVGIARLEPDTHDAHALVISVALAPEARGLGLGSALVEETSLAARALARRVVALIRPDNEPSRRAFARAGYRPEGSTCVDGVTLERHVLALAPAPTAEPLAHTP